MLLSSLTCLAITLPYDTYNVFTPGESGVKAFRIPGLLSTPRVLLAYAEGRVEGCGDFAGTHTVVLKRSLDGGKSWGKLQTILDPQSMLGNETCPRVGQAGCEFWDPTAVYDEHTREVHMLASLSTTASGRMGGALTLWVTSSTDAGTTWGTPRNITAQVRHGGPDVFTPGNGHGTQLSSGRLLIAGYRRPAGDESEHCTTIASDDHGKTWFLQSTSGGKGTGNGTSECEVVEVGDDVGVPRKVIMDERMNEQDQSTRGGCGGGVTNCRWRAESLDGGKTWSGPTPVPELPGGTVASGIAPWVTRSSTALLFANTASQTKRENVTLRVSLDAGTTWAHSTLVSVPGGYTDVQLIPDSKAGDAAGVLFEKGTCNGIALAVVRLT
jgi:sialidase-1